MANDPSLAGLRDALRDFAEERDWGRFHTPKNLAISLALEAAEVLELFQWLETGDQAELGEERLNKAQEELADVLMLIVRLADKLDIDLQDAVRKKLLINRQKYPPHLVRGSAKKYDEYK